MKVKKIEDKPMVIHTKKKPRLHLHTGKKAVVRKKAENTVTVKRKRPHPGIRDKMAESGKSVKVRNQSLKMMAVAGARGGAGQIEGGEEITESLDLAAAATAPVMGITSGAGKLYRRKKAENKEKERQSKSGLRKKQGRKDAGQAEPSGHSGESTGNRKRKRKEGKQSREKDSRRKKHGKGSVNGAVKGRMIDTFLENFRTEREGQKDLITSTKSAAKAAALLLAKQAAVALAPLLLVIFFVPAFEAIKEYAAKKGITYKSIEELIRNSDIKKLISDRIEALQEGFSNFEKIKKFTLLPKEFTMESGELTNTLKLRRPVISSRYAREIEAMYA